MKKFNEILVTILAFIVIAIVLGSIIWGIREVYCSFVGMDKEIIAAIIVAATTAFLSILSILIAKYYESRAQIRNQHIEKKGIWYCEYSSLFISNI